jgi:hypothetical protein
LVLTPDSVILATEEHRVLRTRIFWRAGRVGKRQVEFAKVAEKTPQRLPLVNKQEGAH